SAPEHSMAPESLGIPGKADSRLVVFPERLVQRAAVFLLACQLLRAGEGLEVGLAVQYLDQRAVILPAQAEVQGQFIGGTPVVLEIESQDDLSVPPTARVNAAVRPGVKAEEKVGLSQAPRSRRKGVRSGSILTVESDGAGPSEVAGVEGVHLLAEQLAPGLEHVPPADECNVVREVERVVRELLLGSDVIAADATGEASGEVEA